MPLIPLQCCGKKKKARENHVVPGKLFVMSAPSGAGKTTLCDALREKFTDIVYSVSYTTREPREGEKNGVDYLFITEEAFKKNIESRYWAEYAIVHGNYYGTSGALLNRSIQAGRDVLLDIDVEGTRQVLKQYPDAVTVFIMPPSMDVIRSRLVDRGTESHEMIEKRLRGARSEIAQKDLYRHVIVNDRLDEAIEELAAIINKHRNCR